MVCRKEGHLKIAIAAAAFIFASAGAAFAQSDTAGYPGHVVKIVHQYTAGGGTAGTPKPDVALGTGAGGGGTPGLPGQQGAGAAGTTGTALTTAGAGRG